MSDLSKMQTQKDRLVEELKRIKKQNWAGTIELLESNFRGYPLNQDQQPAAAILEILITLDVDDNIEERFLSRVYHLECFTYRAYYKNINKTIYWNPLEESFLEFSKHSPISYQSDMEYPATDIINQWIWKQIKE